MSLFGSGGAAGWVVPGLAIAGGSAAGGGYTLFMWGRAKAAPTNAAFLSWSGSTGGSVHAELGVEPTPADQYKWQDQDDAFVGSGSGIQTTMGGWHSVCYTHTNTLNSFYVDRVANVANTVVAQGAQTLIQLFIGQDDVGTVASATDEIAECAGWLGVHGPGEMQQLLSGACPLRIRREALVFYFPLRDDLRNYSAIQPVVSGPKPVFGDHPPCEDFRPLMRRPMLETLFGRRGVPT